MTLIIHIQPLSNSLLLTISPPRLCLILISLMSLSSRKRSIFNTFFHILPCVAPVCEGMHYHKTGVPWQTKSTFIIVFSLFRPGTPRFARNSVVMMICSKMTKCSKLDQNLASYYYRLIVKLVVNRK